MAMTAFLGVALLRRSMIVLFIGTFMLAQAIFFPGSCSAGDRSVCAR
ncbi:MAG TPA: hypothetical protein VMS22_23400 [Candidatus Eisenbacteria bacterium]|nr:hypothetical protein [Candidatus Eisenbacteria bacterium]